MRRVLVGANTRGYNKLFVDVLKAAQEAARMNTSIPDAIEMALLWSGNLSWISDAEIESAFVGRQFYGVINQLRLRTILGALNMQMHRDDQKNEQPHFDYDSLQIEHVLPQSWSAHWPLNSADGADIESAKRVRDEAVNRIGNLTLVTAPLNPAMSNGDWLTKRTALETHSSLKMNSALLAMVGEKTWNETWIDQRARDLAKVAVRLWPRPASVIPPAQ
jgi:hypothetical protein